MTQNYKIGSTDIFTKTELDFFKKTVINANEVDSAAFNGLVTKKPILILYPDSYLTKAVGALKIPNESYKNRVFKKAKAELNPIEYDFELGWIVSLEPGNGKAVTKILSEYSSKVYATIRDENVKMIHIVTSLGFRKVGSSYNSTRGNYKLSLYVKQK